MRKGIFSKLAVQNIRNNKSTYIPYMITCIFCIWEKRCGRGDANQIYLASVTPIDDSSYECAPFSSREYESCGSRTADSAFLDAEEPQDTRPQNLEIPAFRTADSDVPEPQDLGASNTDFSQPDTAFSDVSPSVPSEDGPADDEKELTGILDACELSYFEPEVARVFENAIERLFYSDNLRIGQAVLPRSRVRSRLHRLNYFVLQEARPRSPAFPLFLQKNSRPARLPLRRRACQN